MEWTFIERSSRSNELLAKFEESVSDQFKSLVEDIRAEYLNIQA